MSDILSTGHFDQDWVWVARHQSSPSFALANLSAFACACPPADRCNAQASMRGKIDGRGSPEAGKH